MIYVGVHGSNATGKSTRTFYLIKWLEQVKGYQAKPYYYNHPENGNTKIGLLFPEIKWFFLGKYVKNKTNWVSLDAAVLSSYDRKEEFYKYLLENESENIDVYYQEGYFNNRSERGNIDNLKKLGFTNCYMYFLLYDDINYYIKRCNERMNTNKGLEWAENSPGWRDNYAFTKLMNSCLTQNTPNDIVKRIDVDSPKTQFIQEFFGDEISNLPEPEEIHKEYKTSNLSDIF